MSHPKNGRGPVRVLHLRDSPWIDGPGRTILETSSRIDRSRVDYHVGVFVEGEDTGHPLVQALLKRGLPVHTIADRGGVGPEMVRQILELMERLEIDILHTSEFRSNVLALLCRRRRAVKLVSTAHGWIANDLRGRTYTLADRILLRLFDRVILVSRAMRRRLPQWWVADAKVRMLHNALMTDSYGKETLAAPRRTINPSGEVRVLNVGRLSPEKGQLLLLQSVHQLVPLFPGLQLWFAGVGPLEQQLRQAANNLAISDRVRFLGYVPDMPALYKEVDLVVQSSLTEGLPNVMLEVAYLGVPVIATDVGGTAEVIEHAQSGWLVKAGSATALAEGIRSFLSNPGDFVAMAARGRQRIESEFAIDARTERQVAIYEEVAC